jgi:PST family polysaccharide transporter
MRSLTQLVTHPLAKNTLAASVTQLANFLPLLLLPVLTQRLGIASFGSVAMVLSLSQLSLIITDFGYGLSSTYRIACHREDRILIGRLLGSVFVGKIPLVATASLISLLIPVLIPSYQEDFPIFALGILAIVGQAYQANWLFIGLERMKVVTVYSLSTKAIYLLIVLLYVHDANDAWLVILGWGVAQLAAAGLSILQIYRCGYYVARPQMHEVAQEFRTALPFFTSRIAVATYTSAATTIVGLSGQIQAAQFYACQQVYRVGSALPVNQVLYPFMAKTRNWRVFLLVTFGSALALALVAGLLASCSGFVLQHALGNDFIAAQKTFIIMLAAMVASYLAAAFGYPAFAALDRLDQANRTVLQASIANILLLTCLYVIDQINAQNVALAILATELLVLVLRIRALLNCRKALSHSITADNHANHY